MSGVLLYSYRLGSEALSECVAAVQSGDIVREGAISALY